MFSVNTVHAKLFLLTHISPFPKNEKYAKILYFNKSKSNFHAVFATFRISHPLHRKASINFAVTAVGVFEFLRKANFQCP